MHTDSVWHLVSALSCMFFSLSPFYQTEESSVTCSQREAAHALSQWPVNSLLTEARPPLCEPQPEPIHRRKVSTVHWLFTHIYLTIKVLKLIKSFWLLITPTLKKIFFLNQLKKKTWSHKDCGSVWTNSGHLWCSSNIMFFLLQMTSERQHWVPFRLSWPAGGMNVLQRFYWCNRVNVKCQINVTTSVLCSAPQVTERKRHCLHTPCSLF